MVVENSSRDLARGEYQPQASGSGFWRNTLLIYGILILVTAVLTHSPAAPYNVRELLYPSLPWLSTLLLGALPLLLWLPPVYFATRLQRGRIGLAPLYPFAHASAIWLLLTLAVPTESLDDILGSPILHWSMWLERWMRMVALFGGWSAIATCAVLPLITRAKRPWRVCGLLTLSWLVIAHWGVVTEAATDNLTELMAGGGSAFAILMLASAMGLLTATSAILARTFVRQGRSEQVLGLLLLPLLILLALGGFWLGMEHELHKYGQNFSAVQFLLSKGRDAYASGPRLALRAAIALCGVVGVGALAQWPAWRRLAANKDLVTIPNQ
jgi:hypothetical protein